MAFLFGNDSNNTLIMRLDFYEENNSSAGIVRRYGV